MWFSGWATPVPAGVRLGLRMEIETRGLLRAAWIRRTTIGCAGMPPLIAGTVSYMHMHPLVSLRGQPGWAAALTPLSVDGMIVAASTTLLATQSR